MLYYGNVLHHVSVRWLFQVSGQYLYMLVVMRLVCGQLDLESAVTMTESESAICRLCSTRSVYQFILAYCLLLCAELHSSASHDHALDSIMYTTHKT